jgi:hypothetical protein
MGIYLGQLPPAEIARLKAELAETLIANFCYPRFFDHRTQSLQMRPVDRVKRQEVWLYLSSVDFTAWNRVDLMSPDFQHYVERLFIQFVQRNRSFFGNQGRRRMPDIRMLISSCAASVSVSLRNHVTGQKQNGPTFGSPRPVLSWGMTSISGRPEPGWEQIAENTLALQQQLQELRGESKTPAALATQSPTASVADGTARRATRPQAPVRPISPTPTTENNNGMGQQPTAPTTPIQLPPGSTSRQVPQTPQIPAASVVSAATPLRTDSPRVLNGSSPAGARSSVAVAPASESKKVTSGELSVQNGASISSTLPPVEVKKVSTSEPAARLNGAQKAVPVQQGNTSTATKEPDGQERTSGVQQAVPPIARSLSPTPTTSRDVVTAGEDDLAIFEQMRHQLTVWLRIEAITAGLEIGNLTSTQLLELLRQQSRLDETRIQVISTLLNLANQVLKTGVVSALDYKQALMFHLMHTRR